MFLLKTSKRFLSFVIQFIPIEQLKDVLITTTGSKGSLKWENLIISIVRIGLIAVLAISYKMRNSIKS
jgi:ABC-type Fe3+-siderophore transport system permease subunit